MNSIFKRRSIRKFLEKTVEEDKVERVLRAAMQSPSAANQQGWEFIVVRSKKSLKKLSEISQYAKLIEGADLAIVVLGNKNTMIYPQYMEQDLGAATENLMLQGVEEGLGSVWLGVAPETDRMEHIKNMFELPKGVEGFAIVAMGYPVEENKFVDRWDSKKVFYEKYN